MLLTFFKYNKFDAITVCFLHFLDSDFVFLYNAALYRLLLELCKICKIRLFLSKIETKPKKAFF